MLTLNQTAGNNNNAIWVIKLHAEAANVITLGDFSASTGWTAGGDWAIAGGVATYTYADDETGTLSREIVTTTDEYIFEYEVVSITGTMGLKLDSSSGIIASDLTLETTVGKHIYYIKCNSGTTFKLTLDGAGGTDVLVIDNVKLRLVDNNIKLATKDIALDEVSWDGKVLNFDNRVSDVIQETDISNSGGIGSVSNFAFSISRYVDNSSFNSFFNEYYPATDGGTLTSRLCEIGVVWVGATTEAEITWIMRGRVFSYNYTQRTMDLIVYQESEFQAAELPYYKIQKDFNNGVSYFTTAPDESYGLPIPVLYGDFTLTSFQISSVALAPVIVADKNKTQAVVCSHKAQTVVYANYSPIAGDTYSLFRSVGNGNYYQNLYSSTTSGSNTNTRHDITLQGTAGVVYARCLIPFTSLGSQSSLSTVDNATDKSASTYVTLTPSQVLALRIETDMSASEFGQISHKNAAHLRQIWCVAAADASEVAFTTYFYNENGMDGTTPNTPEQTSTGHASSITGTTLTEVTLDGFARETTATKEYPALPHRIDELTTYDYCIRNDDADTNLRVAYGFLEFTEILASGSLSRIWGQPYRQYGGRNG